MKTIIKFVVDQFQAINRPRLYTAFRWIWPFVYQRAVWIGWWWWWCWWNRHKSLVRTWLLVFFSLNVYCTMISNFVAHPQFTFIIRVRIRKICDYFIYVCVVNPCTPYLYMIFWYTSSFALIFQLNHMV